MFRTFSYFDSISELLNCPLIVEIELFNRLKLKLLFTGWLNSNISSPYWSSDLTFAKNEEEALGFSSPGRVKFDA